MNFNLNVEVRKVAKFFEGSASLRRLAPGLKIVTALYAIPAILHAVAAFLGK